MKKSHYVSIMNHTNLNLYWVNIGYNIIIHKNLYEAYLHLQIIVNYAFILQNALNHIRLVVEDRIQCNFLE